MTVKETHEIIVQYLELVISWPVIVLIVVLIFRAQIPTLLSNLISRIRRATIAGQTVEFSEQEIDAFRVALKTGSEELKDPESLSRFIREQMDKLAAASTVQDRVLPSLRGRRILWVDDNPQFIAYEKHYFERLGADIDHVLSTDDALAKLSRAVYDLVISDVLRTENGGANHDAGYELLDKMRAAGVTVPLAFYLSNVTYLNHERSQDSLGAADTPHGLLTLILDKLKD